MDSIHEAHLQRILKSRSRRGVLGVYDPSSVAARRASSAAGTQTEDPPAASRKTQTANHQVAAMPSGTAPPQQQHSMQEYMTASNISPVKGGVQEMESTDLSYHDHDNMSSTLMNEQQPAQTNIPSSPAPLPGALGASGRKQSPLPDDRCISKGGDIPTTTQDYLSPDWRGTGERKWMRYASPSRVPSLMYSPQRNLHTSKSPTRARSPSSLFRQRASAYAASPTWESNQWRSSPMQRAPSYQPRPFASPRRDSFSGQRWNPQSNSVLGTSFRDPYASSRQSAALPPAFLYTYMGDDQAVVPFHMRQQQQQRRRLSPVARDIRWTDRHSDGEDRRRSGDYDPINGGDYRLDGGRRRSAPRRGSPRREMRESPRKKRSPSAQQQQQRGKARRGGTNRMQVGSDSLQALPFPGNGLMNRKAGGILYSSTPGEVERTRQQRRATRLARTSPQPRHLSSSAAATAGDNKLSSGLPDVRSTMDLKTSTQILLAGDWFYKWQQDGSEVQPRWIWIDTRSYLLVWSRKETHDATFCGSLPLENIWQITPRELVQADAEGMPMTFYVLLIETTRRVLQLATERKEKADIWFEALNNVVAFVRRHDVYKGSLVAD